jgi:hypothetical protein
MQIYQNLIIQICIFTNTKYYRFVGTSKFRGRLLGAIEESLVATGDFWVPWRELSGS